MPRALRGKLPWRHSSVAGTHSPVTHSAVSQSFSVKHCTHNPNEQVHPLSLLQSTPDHFAMCCRATTLGGLSRLLAAMVLGIPILWRTDRAGSHAPRQLVVTRE